MVPRIRVDLNERVDGVYVPVRQSEMPFLPLVGTQVQVFEPEDRVVGTATVSGVRGSFVLLTVDWDTLRDDIQHIQTAATGNTAVTFGMPRMFAGMSRRGTPLPA